MALSHHQSDHNPLLLYMEKTINIGSRPFQLTTHESFQSLVEQAWVGKAFGNPMQRAMFKLCKVKLALKAWNY